MAGATVPCGPGVTRCPRRTGSPDRALRARPAEWNAGKAADQGEFAKLSVPCAEAKPGKLPYALRYEEAHGIG
ncbi:hypothetical protein ACFU5N_17860 [Streptomyces albidoflavus]